MGSAHDTMSSADDGVVTARRPHLVLLGAVIMIASACGGGAPRAQPTTTTTARGLTLREWLKPARTDIIALGDALGRLQALGQNLDLVKGQQVAREVGDAADRLVLTMKPDVSKVDDFPVDAQQYVAVLERLAVSSRAVVACVPAECQAKFNGFAADAVSTTDVMIRVNTALGAAQPSTTSSQPTTTTAQCLRVSAVFAATLDVRPRSALGAVQTKDPSRWYVASADGAVWVVDADPTAGVEPPSGSHILPLNEEARTVARFGTAVPPESPEFKGARITDPYTAVAKSCALAAER